MGTRAPRIEIFDRIIIRDGSKITELSYHFVDPEHAVIARDITPTELAIAALEFARHYGIALIPVFYSVLEAAAGAGA